MAEAAKPSRFISEALLSDRVVGALPMLASQTRIYVTGHSGRPSGAPRAGTAVPEIRLTQRGLEFDLHGQHIVIGSGSWVAVIEKACDA